jgi:4-hydroxybenzoate polyprenyltransferase/phosphoserine phosphatase
MAPHLIATEQCELSAPGIPSVARAKPLCVDLDGTLVKTDLLLEGVLLLLKQNILFLFLLPCWLLRGKAYLKQEVSRRVRIDVATLPYHQALLALLREARREGRQVVLVTAADREVAEAVASHLGLFTEVLASDGRVNLSGAHKLQALRERFGDGGFDYAANAAVDLAVWREADRALVVNADQRTRRRAERMGRVAAVLEDRPRLVHSLPRALRVHQWVKNLLVFVPLIASHQITNLALLGQAGLAFVAFSLCASSVYVLNDLLDLPADRRHTRKKHRPFAAGNLSLAAGAYLSLVLLAGGAATAALLPPLFLAALALYYGLTLAYSLFFKRKLLIDVHILAGLYTIRVLAGGVAIGVVCSPWLLAFSMFLFLSLALVKRFTELRQLRRRRCRTARGRGYRASDCQLIAALGACSGLMCVMVLALYINGPQVEILYGTPTVLWLLCPLLMYWVARVWLIAHRGKMTSDPVVFAIKDKVSYLVGLCSVAVVIAATCRWNF